MHINKPPLRIVDLNLSNFKAIDHLVIELAKQPIYILINNAGVFVPKTLSDKTLTAGVIATAFSCG